MTFIFTNLISANEENQAKHESQVRISLNASAEPIPYHVAKRFEEWLLFHFFLRGVVSLQSSSHKELFKGISTPENDEINEDVEEADDKGKDGDEIDLSTWITINRTNGEIEGLVLSQRRVDKNVEE